MGRKSRKGIPTESTVIHSESLFIKKDTNASPQQLKARTATQSQYMAEINAKDIVFASGPAGTGKTFVAVGMACEALSNHHIESIIITRPAVSCGEDLGALPGELEEKYVPWIDPLIDAFEYHMGASQFKYALKHNYIKAQPLMYMRGKTYHKSWMLLDEAQNTSPVQMKMFLTRMGKGSKAIVTGDMSQHDRFCSKGDPLPSGLSDAIDRLNEVPEIGFVNFKRQDQIRHKLVGKILDCYG